MEIKDLKKDHILINRHIKDIERLRKNNKINLNNLKTKFRDLCYLWNTHEEKEETLSNIKNKKTLELEKFPLEHRELKGHKKVIDNALKSRDQIKIKVALDTDGRMFIDKLKDHMGKEEYSLEM